MNNILNLSYNEKRTFKLHLTYSIIEGSLGGIVALNEFIFLKSLVGTKYLLGMMFQIPQMVLLLAIIMNEIIRRTKHKKNFILWYMIASRLPMLILLFFPSSVEQVTMFHRYVFLFVLLMYFLSMPVMFPTVTLFLRNVYSPFNFGKLYSYATSASKITLVVSTFIAGMLLDDNQFFYRYLYTYMAFAGVLSIVIFVRIPYEDKLYEVKTTLVNSIKSSLNRMTNIVRFNRPFLHYQIAFMLYGIAYMTTESVIPLFLKEIFDVKYSGLAFYKNTFNIINIILLPFFGHFVDRVDPRKFSAISFGALAFSFIFFLLANFFRNYFFILQFKVHSMLIMAYIFYGIFAATMGIAWYIGPAYFCHPSQAGDYQAVHLGFTGIRGMFAPLLGIVFYSTIGFIGVFAIAIVFTLLAIAVMLASIRRKRILIAS